ncbi:MAG: cell division topological specificity factor MinE [Clostridioides sp.]|nr:cell division topological specificity factor MinE [Clostridioides sp.]
MFDLFKTFSNDSRKSKSVAKERLRVVLVQDRIDCSPQILELIKNDIRKAIENYAEIDVQGLEIKMSKTRGEDDRNPTSSIIANIPLRGLKERTRQ